MCCVLLHFTLSVSKTFEASLIVSTRDMLVTIIDDLGVLNSSQFRDFPNILTKVKIFTIENLVLPKLGCTWENVMLSFCPVLGSTMMTFESLFFWELTWSCYPTIRISLIILMTTLRKWPSVALVSQRGRFQFLELKGLIEWVGQSTFSYKEAKFPGFYTELWDK